MNPTCHVLFFSAVVERFLGERLAELFNGLDVLTILVNINSSQTMGTYKLRIILESDDIRKMTLAERPQSLENLLNDVKQKLRLEGEFYLMYEDPDFDNGLCNLEDINDLPPEKATVKVTEEKLEEERKDMMEEIKKRYPSDPVIKLKMDKTFPIRQQEIVNSAPPVKVIRERWPALFTEKQIIAEFNRITTLSLENNFYEALDRYTPQFLKLFKSKKGSKGGKLSKIVQQTDSCDHEVTKLHTLVIRGLSVLLGEDSTNFYLSCMNLEEENQNDWGHITVGILISEDGPLQSDDLHLDPKSLSIILEGDPNEKAAHTRMELPPLCR
ncbi:hypothetical protein WMY93_032256 [Mugilogobius chulae]|uniref:Uncharacterized protein n=1 Tax=Mugilogobius chulae TaxID=88201 RepID=A0AAW0MKH9_9GOBI